MAAPDVGAAIKDSLEFLSEFEPVLHRLDGIHVGIEQAVVIHEVGTFRVFAQLASSSKLRRCA